MGGQNEAQNLVYGEKEFLYQLQTASGIKLGIYSSWFRLIPGFPPPRSFHSGGKQWKNVWEIPSESGTGFEKGFFFLFVALPVFLFLWDAAGFSFGLLRIPFFFLGSSKCSLGFGCPNSSWKDGSKRKSWGGTDGIVWNSSSGNSQRNQVSHPALELVGKSQSRLLLD